MCKIVGMRATPRLTAALVLVVFASASQAGPRKQCRRACGSAVRSCMTTTGQGLRACREEMLRRCAREGLQACSSSLLPPAAGSCSESAAPACAGSCPLAEFSCVPNPLGGCNCEAPACDRARSSRPVTVCVAMRGGSASHEAAAAGVCRAPRVGAEEGQPGWRPPRPSFACLAGVRHRRQAACR